VTTREMWEEAVSSRYRDAYRIGRAVDRVGESVKALGLLLGIVAGLGLFVSTGSIVAPSKTPIAAIGGAVVFALVWAPFWVAGVLIAGVAQMDMASLDSAVNSSPFLDDEQRAAVMSLTAPEATDRRSDVQVRVTVCEACGDHIEEQSAFCPSCGARQENAAC